MKTSPATKAAAISDYLAGNGGYQKIANRYGISTCVLISWIKNQERALSPRNRNGIIPKKSVNDGYTGLLERSDMEEPEFKTKDAEIKYLRDKIAYLETLSELMGYDTSKVAKKKDLKSSSNLSQEDDVQISPGSAK